MKFLEIYFRPKLLIILGFGFSSGLPLLLTMSTLGWWLHQYGLKLSTISMFAFAGTPYILKPLWAPIVDSLELPILHVCFGRRKSWLLLSQICLMLSIIILGHSNPENNLSLTAIAAVLVAFCSATQDIVVDAYRIELLSAEDMSAGSAMEVFGYRLGMMVAGGFALYLSDHYSWDVVFTIMACFILVGVATTLVCKEPPIPAEKSPKITNRSLKNFILEGIVEPFLDFRQKPGWLWILIFIIIYRLGDNLIGPMNVIFYKHLGFTATEVGVAAKTCGIWMGIFGAMVGGIIGNRVGIMRTLLVGAILHLASHMFFIALAINGYSLPLLYATVIAESITGGVMTCGFVAYFSMLCSVRFTATQYTLFSALMSQARVIIQSQSGRLAEHFGWVGFFVFISVASIPSIILLVFLMRKHPLKQFTQCCPAV